MNERTRHPYDRISQNKMEHQNEHLTDTDVFLSAR